MNVLRAEWTKLRTSPGTGWLVACVVATTVGVSALAAAVTTCGRDCALDPARVSLTGIYPGQALVAILGVLVVGTEYSTGTMRLTLAAVPRRLAVLAAKAGIVVVVAAATGLVATVLSLLAGRWLLPGTGLPPLHLGSGAVLRAATGTVLYLVLIAVLSLAVAVVVRDSATAIGAVLALLYVFPVVAQAAGDEDLRRHLKQVGPMTAGLSVQATHGLDELPIGPWQGLAVVAAWAVGALAAAAVLLVRRDA